MSYQPKNNVKTYWNVCWGEVYCECLYYKVFERNFVLGVKALKGYERGGGGKEPLQTSKIELFVTILMALSHWLLSQRVPRRYF